MNTLPNLNDMKAIENNLNTLMIMVLERVIEYIQTGGNPPQTQLNELNTEQRVKEFRNSERKRALKETQLYYDANLKESFQKSIAVSF